MFLLSGGGTGARCGAVFRILDRYIFTQVLAACAATVGFFTFVVMAANAFKDLFGYILAGQLSWGATAELLFLLLPLGVSYALPMGMLAGILLVLGRLSSESEIIAMRAAGQSLRRISAPIYVLAVLGMLGGWYVNFYSMPYAKTQYEERFATMARTAPLNLIVPKTFIRDFKGVVAYVGEKHGADLTDVWVWWLDTQLRVTRFIHGQTGRVSLDEAANQMVITLNHASGEVRREADPEDYSTPPTIAAFEATTQAIPLEKIFGQHSFHRKMEWWSPAELHAELARLSGPAGNLRDDAQRERDRMRIQMVIQEKYTMGFAILAFSLVAVPLGIKVSRRETSANLGVAVALALSYYFLTVMIKWLATQPELRPDILLWAPSALFLGVGLWLNARIGRAG